MAQLSRPWAGRTPASPGDAGSYTAEQWWNVWGPMMAASNKLTFPALNNVGVFLASDFGGSAWVNATVYPVGSIVRPTVDNYHAYMCTAIAGTGTSAGAEPTWPTYPGYTVIDNAGANQITWTCLPPGGMYPYSIANNSVSIAPGVAIVDGNVLESSAIESFVVPNATAGNVRDDRVVARKTFGAVTQTTRLVLLSGGEVASPGPGTPPALTQSRTRATYWDIPIARVSVTDAGVITVTDEREFVDAVVHKWWVPAVVGDNLTTVTVINLDHLFIPGILLNSIQETAAYGSVSVPDNFVSSMEFEAVFLNQTVIGPDDVVLENRARYSACGESFITHSDTSSTTQTVSGNLGNLRVCIDTLLELDDANVGDNISLRLKRDGANPADTLGSDLQVAGWNMYFIGWR